MGIHIHTLYIVSDHHVLCCGSETFISDPVSDPDLAFSEFRIWIRFRIRIRIRIQIQIRILDSNPDPDPEFESGSETGQNFFFLN
jgi:hypothetical protein